MRRPSQRPCRSAVRLHVELGDISAGPAEVPGAHNNTQNDRQDRQQAQGLRAKHVVPSQHTDGAPTAGAGEAEAQAGGAEGARRVEIGSRSGARQCGRQQRPRPSGTMVAAASAGRAAPATPDARATGRPGCEPARRPLGRDAGSAGAAAACAKRCPICISTLLLHCASTKFAMRAQG